MSSQIPKPLFSSRDSAWWLCVLLQPHLGNLVPRARTTLVRSLLMLAASFAMVACGGKSGGSPNSPAPAGPQGPGAELTITVQPTDQDVQAGGTVVFSVQATGSGDVSYQWRKLPNVDSEGESVPDATSSTLRLSGVSLDLDGTLFAVVVSDRFSSKRSSVVRLAVRPVVIAPQVTSHPAATRVVAGSDASFTATISGTSPSLQWQSSSNGAIWTDIQGQTTSTLRLLAVRLTDSGLLIRIRASNAAGEVSSSVAQLTVDEAPAPPSFTSQPVSVSLTAGTSATFSVAFTGTPNPTVQWESRSAGGLFAPIPGATQPTFTTGPTSGATSGSEYRATISNASGTAVSTPALLTVNPTSAPPIIITQPASTSVIAPAPATFSVAFTGFPAPTIQWEGRSASGLFAPIAGATQATFTTGSTSVANSGSEYRAVIRNTSGSVTTAPAVLTVTPAPAAPVFTAQPSSTSVVAPSSATFSVAFTGFPAPTVQWESRSASGLFAPIAGATQASFTTGSTSVTNSGSEYRATIRNASGSVTSTPAVLTVTAAPAAPVITTQPTSTSVTAPASATFSIAFTGSPVPTVQWESRSASGVFALIPGATQASFATGPTSVANSGSEYRATITNGSGVVTSTAATLTVNPAQVAPVITTQPLSVSVVAPTVATFSVAVQGQPTPTLQWQYSDNGGATFANINGATSSTYTTPATTIGSNNRRYRVVATNSASSVTSGIAVLTVTAPSCSVAIQAPGAKTRTVVDAGAATALKASVQCVEFAVPNGTPVSFATTFGSLAPATVSVATGAATSTFNSQFAGQASVSASVSIGGTTFQSSRDIFIRPAPGPFGLLVPAYFYPATNVGQWELLIGSIDPINGPPITVILNPSNGEIGNPTTTVPAEWSDLARLIVARGGRAVGYVHVRDFIDPTRPELGTSCKSQDRRSLTAVQADIDRYEKVLGASLSGYFIDEAGACPPESQWPELELFVSQLRDYIKAKATGGRDRTVIANVGPQATPPMALAADVLVVVENYASVFASTPNLVPSWAYSYKNDRFATIIHSTSGCSGPIGYRTVYESLVSAEQNSSWLFVTDFVYGALPSYWADSLRMLRAFNQSGVLPACP